MIITLCSNISVHQVVDHMVKTIARCQIRATISRKDDHFVKYVCTSRSVKKAYPFHEMDNFL